MAKRLPSRRALIVDDEFLIALDLESSMRELGFNVCTVASNENDAIELAKSNRPDVVVMDVYLGGTRAGIEAARWLREVCGVPIVLCDRYCDADTQSGFTRLYLLPLYCLSQFIARRWLTRYQQLLSEGIRSQGRRFGRRLSMVLRGFGAEPTMRVASVASGLSRPQPRS
jgi:CheY-like chemotaxis protein